MIKKANAATPSLDYYLLLQFTPKRVTAQNLSVHLFDGGKTDYLGILSSSSFVPMHNRDIFFPVASFVVGRSIYTHSFAGPACCGV